MTIHLIKLAVGPENLNELAEWQTQRLKELKRRRQPLTLMHVTRHRPKRAEELLEGGSLYWVIKGMIVARQRLLAFAPVIKDNVTHCGLVYDPQLMVVQMRPRRPFQGWRYLEAADAPADIAPWSATQSETDTLQRELMALGLLS